MRAESCGDGGARTTVDLTRGDAGSGDDFGDVTDGEILTVDSVFGQRQDRTMLVTGAGPVVVTGRAGPAHWRWRAARNPTAPTCVGMDGMSEL